jgi:hypothetical protein
LPLPPDKNLIKLVKEKVTLEGIDYSIVSVGTQRFLVAYRQATSGPSIAVVELEE